jgi:hypothetical protein
LHFKVKKDWNALLLIHLSVIQQHFDTSELCRVDTLALRQSWYFDYKVWIYLRGRSPGVTWHFRALTLWELFRIERMTSLNAQTPKSGSKTSHWFVGKTSCNFETPNTQDPLILIDCWISTIKNLTYFFTHNLSPKSTTLNYCVFSFGCFLCIQRNWSNCCMLN